MGRKQNCVHEKKNVYSKQQEAQREDLTRELNKESPMYCYHIYTNNTWSILVINNLTLISIYQL